MLYLVYALTLTSGTPSRLRFRAHFLGLQFLTFAFALSRSRAPSFPRSYFLARSSIYVQYSKEWKARMRKPGQERQDKTGKTRQARQAERDREKTGGAKHDILNWISRTRKAEQERQSGTGRTVRAE